MQLPVLALQCQGIFILQNSVCKFIEISSDLLTCTPYTHLRWLNQVFFVTAYLCLLVTRNPYLKFLNRWSILSLPLCLCSFIFLKNIIQCVSSSKSAICYFPSTSVHTILQVTQGSSRSHEAFIFELALETALLQSLKTMQKFGPFSSGDCMRTHPILM